MSMLPCSCEFSWLRLFTMVCHTGTRFMAVLFAGVCYSQLWERPHLWLFCLCHSSIWDQLQLLAPMDYYVRRAKEVNKHSHMGAWHMPCRQHSAAIRKTGGNTCTQSQLLADRLALSHSHCHVLVTSSSTSTSRQAAALVQPQSTKRTANGGVFFSAVHRVLFE